VTEHRYEARAEIVPGECELVIGGRIQLVTLTLSDAGPITLDDGTDRERTGFAWA
jgi:hypothetical protein